MRREVARDAALAPVLVGGATRVGERLSGLVLQVALGLSVRPPGERASALPSWDEVRAALGEVNVRCQRAGLRSPALTDPAVLGGPEELRRFLDGDTLSALLDAVLERSPEGAFVSRDPGVIHQELLEIGLAWLDAPSVRFSAGGPFISSRDVLARAPAIRSKWLQREADLPKGAVQRYAATLALARTEEDVVQALTARAGSGVWAESAGALVVAGSGGRRRSGSHYTPPALRRKMVERLLAPLVENADPATIRALRICDPAMGAGDFLVEVARYLTDKLVNAEASEAERLRVLHDVVSECLYGVDKDPLAVDLARWSLSRLVATAPEDAPDLSRHLKCGDALVGEPLIEPPSPAESRTDKKSLRPLSDPQALPPSLGPRFHWRSEFPEVFAPPRAGFDACVGNPPWVAYAGRAAQPLDPALARYYERTNPAFHGYRTLHGLFVRRSAELLRAGGRLGLVLPTSVADLAGYARTRAAHDALSDPDPDLTDFGDGAFDAVFQPCMALTSTRRAADASAPTATPPGAPWTLARTDLDAVGISLLGRLSALPPLEAALFGERGFQTTGDDLSQLRKLEAPETPFTLPIREGTDVREFARAEPRTFLNPLGVTGRVRALEDFQRVVVLIRQTARYPIAALSDGVAFRNSILAGFSNDDWSASALVAYLNSSIVRWYHYTRHRDARQGMPQLKIGHLRALPHIGDATARARLDEFGSRIGRRNVGLSESEREELDAIVADAFGLSDAEREMVRRFFAANRPPEGRKRGAS